MFYPCVTLLFRLGQTGVKFCAPCDFNEPGIVCQSHSQRHEYKQLIFLMGGNKVELFSNIKLRSKPTVDLVSTAAMLTLDRQLKSSLGYLEWSATQGPTIEPLKNT